MKRTIYLILLLCLPAIIIAQDQEVDASKPTNFYTQLYNHLEYESRKTGGDLMGYRAEFLYAPSEAHLLLAEIPLLYHNGKEKLSWSRKSRDCAHTAGNRAG